MDLRYTKIPNFSELIAYEIPLRLTVEDNISSATFTIQHTSFT